MSTKKHRLQFDFTPTQVAALDNLTECTSAMSRAAVVRRALALYAQFVQIQQEGGHVRHRDADGEETRLMIL